MISENKFDMVFDCQKVFKGFMNALARPGRIFSVREQAEKLEGDNRVLMAAALSLLDNRCRYYVYRDEELPEKLRELTMAAETEPKQADYIFVPACKDACSAAGKLLEEAPQGTLPEPHKSAMFLVMLDTLDGNRAIELTGPGINGRIEAHLPEEGEAWLKARDGREYEFPCGVEIIFCTEQGDIMGIPRTVRAGGREAWDM